MARWTFDSNGGCERCDAFDGLHDNEPPRPHENCQCEIARYDEHHCAYWDSEIVEDEMSPGGPPWDHEITIKITVTCCNAEQHTTEITKAWTVDSIDAEREAQHELFDEMEAAAEWLLQNHCIGIA